MSTTTMTSLDPDRFYLWPPPPGATVRVGAERLPLALPDYPLPVHRQDFVEASPSDEAIGQGVYDYLRQFPDCEGNVIYAGLLRDAYPHFIADLASHAVMLEAKDVEPAYVLRMLTCLKILSLIEPDNDRLLRQLSRGYFDLAFEFAELVRCRRHLLEAMRFGQRALAVGRDDLSILPLLAEIDLLFGDGPAAERKFRKLAENVEDPDLLAQIESRLADCSMTECPENTLVDEMESLASAMHLFSSGNLVQAAVILEQIDSEGRLPRIFPSPDYYWLLGSCRKQNGDLGGAIVALQKCLEIDPGHQPAHAVLDSL